MSPRVSVVINCYNGAQFVAEAINSVYAQTYPDWEIVFWDNLSTDATPEIAKGYDERLRYFRGTAFLPLGDARNKALEQCRGDFVAFLDADDIWLPEKLALQVQLLGAQAELGLVYSDCVIQDINGRGRYLSSQVDKFYSGWALHALIECDFIPMLTVVVRRDVLAKVGPFRSYQIVEDYDMWLRIAAHYPIDYVDRPLAVYRTHVGQWSRRFEVALEEVLSMYDSIVGDEALRREDVKAVVGRARAQAYHNAARAALFVKGDRALCRRYLRMSRTHHASRGVALLYGMSFLPLPVLIRLRNLKQAVSRRVRS